MPLIIRLKLGIEIQNPLLEEITQNMPLEFTLAKYIADIIGKKYNRHISDDENWIFICNNSFRYS